MDRVGLEPTTPEGPRFTAGYGYLRRFRSEGENKDREKRGIEGENEKATEVSLGGPIGHRMSMRI